MAGLKQFKGFLDVKRMRLKGALPDSGVCPSCGDVVTLYDPLLSYPSCADDADESIGGCCPSCDADVRIPVKLRISVEVGDMEVVS